MCQIKDFLKRPNSWQKTSYLILWYTFVMSSVILQHEWCSFGVWCLSVTIVVAQFFTLPSALNVSLKTEFLLPCFISSFLVIASARVIFSVDLSMLLWITCSFDAILLVRDHISAPYVIAGVTILSILFLLRFQFSFIISSKDCPTTSYSSCYFIRLVIICCY